MLSGNCGDESNWQLNFELLLAFVCMTLSVIHLLYVVGAAAAAEFGC